MCVGCVRCCLSGLPARGPGRRCDLAEPQGPQPRPRGGRDGGCCEGDEDEPGSPRIARSRAAERAWC